MRDVRIGRLLMIHDTEDAEGPEGLEGVHENSMTQTHPSASAAALAMVGQLIDGRYRVDDIVRDGPMGTVFRATQVSVDRTVALKVMSMRHVSGAGNIDRFLQEAKIVSELTHPNIVRLFDFGKDEAHDALFVVMEFLHGVSLAEMLHGHRLKVDLAVELLYQACGALTEPHNRDVIHRDLKPENMLVVPLPDGSVQLKVVDFGVARALETDKRVTAQGMIFGTPAYMAPEQAQEGAVDARTDLYALGVILYEMLSGRVPFDARTSIQVVLKQIQEAHPALEDVLGEHAPPAGVLDLMDDLLEKDPADRPQTALQLRMELEELVDEYRFGRIRVGTQGPLLERFSRWFEPCGPTAHEPKPTLLQFALPPSLAHSADDSKTQPMAPVASRRTITKPMGLVEPERSAPEEELELQGAQRSPVTGMSMTLSEVTEDDAPVDPRPKAERVAPSPSLRMEAEHLQSFTQGAAADAEASFFSTDAKDLGSEDPQHLFIDEADTPPSSRNLLALVLLGVVLLVGLFVGVLVMSDLGREEVDASVASASVEEKAPSKTPPAPEPIAAPTREASSQPHTPSVHTTSSGAAAPEPPAERADPGPSLEDDSVSERRRAARRKRRAEKRKAVSQKAEQSAPPRIVGDTLPPKKIDSSPKKKPRKKPPEDKLQENLDWLKQR